MILQTKACIMKQVWQFFNNWKKKIISILINLMLILFAIYKFKSFAGQKVDYKVILVIYILIWILYNSIMMVTDIVNEIKNEGIYAQLYISSYPLNRYTLVQIVSKSFFINLFLVIFALVYDYFGEINSLKWILAFIFIMWIGVFSLVGVGYIIGIVSLFQENSSLLLIIKLLAIYMVVKSTDNIIIPFARCKYILEDLLIGKMENFIAFNDILVVLCNSFIWYIFGYMLFGWVAERKIMYHNV